MSSIYLTDFDQSATDHSFLEFNRGSGNGSGNNGNSNNNNASRRERIFFQFPLEVLSDSRKTSWTISEARGVDPVATFTSNGAREMSFKATYIVESYAGSDPNRSLTGVAADVFNAVATGDVWTINRIKKQVNTLKGYFTVFNDVNFIDTFLVKFYHNLITGPQPLTCRIQNVSCSYSKTLVGPPGTPLHPLKTEITFDISTYSASAGVGNKDQVFAANADAFPEPEQLWY